MCLMCYVDCFRHFIFWMLEFFNALGQFGLSYMVSQWYGTPHTDSDGQKSDGREKRKSKRKSKRK